MKLHPLSILNQNLHFIGPPIEQGPLPAVFYYALSDLDSLTLSPFNQPVLYLQDLAATLPLRIFSVTLPGHHPPQQKEKALESWADSFANHQDPLAPFLQSQEALIEELLSRELLVKNKIILAGLSRGGLMSCLLAARSHFCRKVLAFAPLTKLSHAKEFLHLKKTPEILQYDLENHLPALAHKKIRFYIGNHDLRVHTDLAVNLICSLAKFAHDQRIRHGSFELMMGNSLGYLGHGTAEKTFKEGALWMFEELFYHE